MKQTFRQWTLSLLAALALSACGGGSLQDRPSENGISPQASDMPRAKATAATAGASAAPKQGIVLDDIDKGSFCYSEPINFSADVSDLKSAYQSNNWLQTITSVYGRRWPSGKALATAQANDQYFKGFVDTSSFNKLAESLMVAIHEETHMWDLAAERTQWNNYSSSWIDEQTQFLKFNLYDSDGGFARKEILSLITDDASSETDEVYLKNAQQGEYHLQGVTAELNASLMGLPAAAAVGEFIDGIGASNSRDLALTNTSYLQLYLRVAKSKHSAYYNKLKSDPTLRKWVLVQFLRNAYHMKQSDRWAAKLGSAKVPRLIARVYAAENLAILEDFTGYTLPKTIDSACMGAAGAPVINSQPQNVVANVGQTVSFSVQASGSGLSYQWRKNGVNLGSNSSSASYIINAVQASDAGSYSVLVSNSLGSTSSNAASLTVNPGSEIRISITPALVTLSPGGSQQFSATVSGSSNTAVTWRVLDTGGGSISSSGRYTAPQAAGSYRIQASSVADASKTAQATVTVSAASTAPVINSQPQAVNAVAGSTASFSVQASGSGPLSYQWRRNGTALSGATGSSYTTPVLSLADHGAVYSVVVSNAAGSVTSAGATLSVSAAGGGTTVTGSLSGAGASATVPGGSPGYLRTTARGLFNAQLSGPAGSDFDLYLYRWNGSSWAVVAKSEGPASSEALSYTGAAGFYYFQIQSYAGGGAYSLTYSAPK
ncbi:immunoglobulin domain-containing protein [Kinneretia aquatilis]|uniref:immunoglobulin domain-containing protein n=1 Tax=Kinneretia aquatilis TaxID=2070761 RepID=UPI0014954132|nr:immunoglobulin domain-containing protein [Paucibacter aquatile]WIV99798.1 immunoglobulin domain-containing protein [Paucibacter aquatile]